MAAGIETFEFTIEDILLMHRGWITKLFIEDKKSEVEIIQVLYERHLVVTLPQLHRCLLDWELIPAPLSTATASTASHVESDDDWEYVSPHSSTFPTMGMLSHNCNGIDPEEIQLYTTRPLPSPPFQSTTSGSSPASPLIQKPSKGNDFAKEPNRGFNLSTVHGVYRYPNHSSSHYPASPLETCLRDQQAHESLAMGLDRVPRVFLQYARAGDPSRHARRTAQTPRRRSRSKGDKRKDNDEDKKDM